MKNQVRSFVISMGISAMFASSFAIAQTRALDVANVPFAFHVKGATLPAGKYIVREPGATGVLQIADAATGHSVMVLTRGRETGTAETPCLTFHRYGNEYFLSQVRMPDQAAAYSLGQTAKEKEMAKEPSLMAVASVRIQAE